MGAGTAGYVLIEGMSLLDALYMTVTTVTTVGYREVQPLGTAGRLFTIALIVTGVGSALYLLARLAELAIGGQLREFMGRHAMQRTVDQLQHHVVVCGFGRFGRVVVEELVRARVPVVVVDVDAELFGDLERHQVPWVQGSALADDVLERAGIDRAQALVAATGSDPDNVFIVLAARERNPKLRIHARAETDAGARRLRQAGADQTVSIYQWGGARLAATIARPSVVDFIELSLPGRGDEVDLEEIRVAAHSAVVGIDIGTIERERTRLRIVALKRGNDPAHIVPEAATRLTADDLLIAIGDRADLDALSRACAEPA